MAEPAAAHADTVARLADPDRFATAAAGTVVGAELLGLDALEVLGAVGLLGG